MSDDGRAVARDESEVGRVQGEVDGVVARVEGSPAPGYGEYAPPGWVNPVRVSADPEPHENADETRGAVATDTRVPETWRGFDAPPPTGAPVPGPPPEARRYRPLNRLGTMILLGYGIYSVVTAAVSVGSFAGGKLTVLAQLGYPVRHFTRTEALQTVGDVSAIAGIALFLVVALWSLRRLRAGKNSWAPLLITGLAANFVTAIAAVMVVFSDPQVSAAVFGG